jgi:hypothetical protein
MMNRTTTENIMISKVWNMKFNIQMAFISPYAAILQNVSIGDNTDCINYKQ